MRDGWRDGRSGGMEWMEWISAMARGFHVGLLLFSKQMAFTVGRAGRERDWERVAESMLHAHSIWHKVRHRNMVCKLYKNGQQQQAANRGPDDMVFTKIGKGDKKDMIR